MPVARADLILKRILEAFQKEICSKVLFFYAFAKA
jgi:hypothetical protein